MHIGTRRLARGLVALALLALPAVCLAGSGAWTETTNENAPGGRIYQVSAWTGSRLVIWGGYNGSGGCGALNTGGLYDPASDTWTATSTTNAPEARGRGTSAVWTGTRLLVWGGFACTSGLVNTGGLYDPATDTWTATSTTGAPSAREDYSLVWTGSKMIAWGGKSGAGVLNSGGIYDPSTDTWTTMTTTNAPSPRRVHSAVWTGSKLVVWGGRDGSWTALDTGGVYDPETDTWTETSMVGAPVARYSAPAVWTGSRMIVWGGFGESDYEITGGAYDPETDTWTTLSTTGAPDREMARVVWTGSKMIAWGGQDSLGYRDDGAIYDPATDTWAPMATLGAPAGRIYHTMVWTGSKMIVWGGQSASLYTGTGGVYDPEGSAGAGPGDLDGDGKPDVLWHNQSTGQLFAWLMDGSTQSSTAFLTPGSVSPAWQVRGIGDLDGDGKNDLLFQNQATGSLYAWLMDGVAQSSATFLKPGSVNPAWQAQGLADFNGDGKVDVLFRHQATGQLYVWFMDGTTQSSGDFLNPSALANASWQIRGLADFNGDAKADILWQNVTSGLLYVWTMDGTKRSEGVYPKPSGVSNPSWEIAQVADFNGDGKPDILWRHQATGQLYLWTMDGLSQASAASPTPGSVANLAWQIVPQ